MIKHMASFKSDKRIILASASPRRRELLSLVTKEFAVVTADVDERAAEIKMEEEGTPALKVSEHLAEIKAKAVFDSLSEGTITLKSEEPVFAQQLYRELISGHTHVVATGVAIFEGGKKKTFTEETRVEFNALDDYQRKLIEDYIDTGSPFDKAGGYGIQDMGALLVKRIDGDYANVVGFPVSRLARELSNMVK